MRSARPLVRPTGFDRMLAPVHRWIWRDMNRRVRKLMRFGETETDGGRDILRAAEVTADPLLRRLYLVHAIDELRHGVMFRQRAASLLPTVHSPSSPTFEADWLAPGGHGLDDLKVDDESDDTMLAFLHLSEKAAASRFTVYRDVLKDDADQPQSVWHDGLWIVRRRHRADRNPRAPYPGPLADCFRRHRRGHGGQRSVRTRCHRRARRAGGPHGGCKNRENEVIADQLRSGLPGLAVKSDVKTAAVGPIEGHRPRP